MMATYGNAFITISPGQMCLSAFHCSPASVVPSNVTRSLTDTSESRFSTTTAVVEVDDEEAATAAAALGVTFQRII